jgi:regulator of protease activity HflC (stomatin/prohibitin superfamily)
MDFLSLVMLAFAALAILILLSGVKTVKQSQCVIIERLGKFYTILESGLNIIIPIVDKPRTIYWVENGEVWPMSRVDMRETVLDVPEQAVITKDNVSISIDALMYIQIVDPKKAAYEISNLPLAVAQLAQTSLRNVIGEMDLDETLISRDIINTKLKHILDEATDKWGTKVNRVELRNITPPADIQQAMEKQMQAERERRAKVLEAQGDKQARVARSEGQREESINLADGEKEAEIRRANGEAEAIRRVAEAQREAIEEIKTALGNNQLAAQYLIASSYIDTLGQFSQKPGDKVYIPYESSEALGTLGSIKELMSQKL